MREAFDLQIHTLKQGSEKKIMDFVNKMTRRHDKDKYLIEKLEALLKSKHSGIKEEPRRFLRMVFLSFILADIGDQLSPFVRNENIGIIKSICEKQDINYNQLVDLTEYNNELMEIVSSIIDTKKSAS